MRQILSLYMQTDKGGREGLQLQADCGPQPGRQVMVGIGLVSPQDLRVVMREEVGLFQILRLKQLPALVWL
jgi:hypothetical protein